MVEGGIYRTQLCPTTRENIDIYQQFCDENNVELTRKYNVTLRRVRVTTVAVEK